MPFLSPTTNAEGRKTKQLFINVPREGTPNWRGFEIWKANEIEELRKNHKPGQIMCVNFLISMSRFLHKQIMK